MLVLEAITGPDEKDVACIPAGLERSSREESGGAEGGVFSGVDEGGSGYGC